MKLIFKIISILYLFSSCSSSYKADITSYSKSYPEPLQQLHANVIKNILNTPNELDIENLLERMNEDGSWDDIDYSSQQRGAWNPRNHLSNLLEIARAYQNKGGPIYQKKAVSKKIHTSLNYWLDNDFICPNWWYPVIGVPMTLNPIVLLMEAELSQEQIEKALVILNRCEIGKTGQNKVWQSGNVLLSSLLTRDIGMIQKASSSIKEELVVSENEGIQADWSYHQHGPQLQFGNYGLSYAADMIKWITILRNTDFDFEDSKVSILRDYLLQGQQWVVWKDQMNISSCGRQLFVDSQVGKAASVAKAMKAMTQVDNVNSELYVNANDYKTLNGNRHFWRSDYQIQRSENYSYSVKMCSERVIGAESCNSENIQGYYMGDGATFLYQSGEEFTNIFPFWDWKKIPGTTIHQDDKPLPILTCSGYRIESDFVGGVSDQKNGIAAMHYIRNGLRANKSWFMMENKIVSLGSGISSSENYPVTTSVNQCYLNGKAVIKSSKEERTSGEREILKNPKWILHDNTGYFFPSGGDLRLETGNVEGSWHDVATRYPDEKIHAGIFKLWFEHGTNPKEDSYAYIILPNANVPQLENMESNNPFKIINNQNVQAIETVDGSQVGVCFYKAGKINLLGGITVNQACLLMVKKQKDGLQVSLSDPTHKLSTIQLKLKGHYNHSNAQIEGDNTLITVSIPSDMEAGKSLNFKLTKV